MMMRKVLGIAAGVVVTAALLYLVWWPLAAMLPMWARVLCSLVALVLGLLAYGLVGPPIGAEYMSKCPHCGRILKRETRWSHSDTSAVGGRAIRQNVPIDYDVCRKCNYEKAVGYFNGPQYVFFRD